jgi:probable addiction module antidote protein
MALKTIAFDIVAELDSEEAIQEYFRQVMADGDSAEIVDALGVIARARGMAQLAKDCGLGRESLYKALSPGAQPRFDTILKVTRALGLELTVAHPQPA